MRADRLKKLVPLAAVALFLFGGWVLRNNLDADRQGEWIRAERGDLVTGFEVTGTLVSMSSATLGPPPIEEMWDFKLSMLAPEGKEIRRGEPVAAFDTTELRRKLEQKTAEADEARKQIEKERNDLAVRTKDERLRLAEAEARLRKAALKLEAPPDVASTNERRATEIEHSIASREAAAIRARLASLEKAATARVDLLSSRMRLAETVVARTQSAIEQMTLRAPRDGTVVYVSDRRGEKKKVGDNVWKMERVVEIPDLTSMKAEGEVDEVDAGRVAIGQRVTLRLDAHPDDEFHGTITAVGQTVQRKRNTQDPLKVLRVEIRLDRTDPAKMRPGMRFQGLVELARIRNAVVVPREAVLLDDRGPLVQRRTTFGVEPVHIRLGRENDRQVQVLEGVAAGDRVLVPKAPDEERES